MSTQSRASDAEALIRASDLQDEVWHLWLRTQEGEEGPRGTAAAGCTDRGAAYLGALSFIIDTGCGYNLITTKCLKSAGAMRLSRNLPQSIIILNTAGGESKALGSVRIACPKFKGSSFSALVMPETPCVISVGELRMDRGFSFSWPA
eukprot:4290666-Pyramimonas_sp.AAC.1